MKTNVREKGENNKARVLTKVKRKRERKIEDYYYYLSKVI